MFSTFQRKHFKIEFQTVKVIWYTTVQRWTYIYLFYIEKNNQQQQRNIYLYCVCVCEAFDSTCMLTFGLNSDFRFCGRFWYRNTSQKRCIWMVLNGAGMYCRTVTMVNGKILKQLALHWNQHDSIYSKIKLQKHNTDRNNKSFKNVIRYWSSTNGSNCIASKTESKDLVLRA